MKNLSNTDGKVQGVQSITAQANSISYSVFLLFTKFDELQADWVDVSLDLPIADKPEIIARTEAFGLAYAISSHCHTDGIIRFEKTKVDVSQMLADKDIELFIRINCHNNISGEIITIYDEFFPYKHSKYTGSLGREVRWYKECGIDTAGETRFLHYHLKPVEVFRKPPLPLDKAAA